MKAGTPADTCTPPTLIAKRWKQPKGPPFD